DERVALEAPARIAEPHLDRGAHVGTSVEWDDTRLVDHLVDDRHVARRLEYLRAVVVDDGQDRAREAARDAAIVVTAVRVRVRGSAALLKLAQRGLPLLRLRRERGHAAVRRIDDQRRLPLRLA